MIDLETARKVIAAAEKKSAEIGQPMNIAVVDAGAIWSRTFGWMVRGSAALTFLLTRLSLRVLLTLRLRILRNILSPGGQFFGIHSANHGRIMIFAGGIPLKEKGKVVGAIDVSGGSGDQDHTVVQAGAAVVR